MKVTLLAYTKLSDDFLEMIDDNDAELITDIYSGTINERAALSLTAIRTCYSHIMPTEIVTSEGAKYFGKPASDGEGGTDGERLIRHIARSGHRSTLEHINYTFAIEGVSRALLGQITRHRHLSFSVQSQRYVKMGSGDKAAGFDYVTPPSIADKHSTTNGGFTAEQVWAEFMEQAQWTYDALRLCGVLAEDARFILPQAAATNIVMTGNLRSLIEVYGWRQPGKGAQWEISELVTAIKNAITDVDPWTNTFFGGNSKW